MLKLLTVEDFEKIKRNSLGYIVITDKPNSTKRLYSVNCPHVDRNNFFRKVIENNG